MITGGGGGGGGTVAVAFGTAANRPAAAAGNANTAYYATDTGELTVSNGTIWNALKSSGATFTAPNFQVNTDGSLSLSVESESR